MGGKRVNSLFSLLADKLVLESNFKLESPTSPINWQGNFNPVAHMYRDEARTKNMTYETAIKAVNTLKNRIIATFGSGAEIRLFGSVARRDFSVESDIEKRQCSRRLKR